MRIYLAGSGWQKLWFLDNFFNFYRLDNYYTISKHEIPYLKKYKNFLLDSGAFTFLNTGKKVDWDKYIEEYANFIKKHDITHFFELDIDAIVGLLEVERLRKKLEYLTGKQCIPVWHKSRGQEYWIKMITEYKYVAIGGIVTKEIRSTQYDIFLYLLNEAKKTNCKVHGLGFTNLAGLKKYKFYSVDSTSWLSGNKYGGIYEFSNGNMIKHKKPIGKKMIPMKTAKHNFLEWVKFQKYADIYL